MVRGILAKVRINPHRMDMSINDLVNREPPLGAIDRRLFRGVLAKVMTNINQALPVSALCGQSVGTVCTHRMDTVCRKNLERTASEGRLLILLTAVSHVTTLGPTVSPNFKQRMDL
jgi:hypothetical protein